MRYLRYICVLLLVPLLFCSCRRTGQSEPEQVLLVSSVGFDRDEEGFRVSLEVPMPGKGEEGDTGVCVFSGSGESVQTALRNIAAGLSRKLVFSHCALMVLGEGLSREQLDEIFRVAGTGSLLPLATQTVAAPDAGELLRAGGLSFVAAGYDIPELFRRESGLLGLDIRCQVYELRANALPAHPVTLPYFEVESEPEHAAFRGLRILREGLPAVTVSAEDCVYYAMLTGSFVGGNGEPGGFGGIELHGVHSSLTAERRGTELCLKIGLHMATSERLEDTERAALEKEIAAGLVAFCADLRARGESGLLGFGERIAADQPELRSETGEAFETLLANAETEAVCVIKSARGGAG